MNWHHGRLAAFDIESTGVDPESDRIVTSTISLVGGGAPIDTTSWLVNPGIEISPGATAVHGITTEMAQAEGRVAPEAVDEITDMLATQVRQGVPIVAFNARFDLTMLDREARRYGIEPLTERIGGREALLVIDPLVLDKQHDRYRKGKRTLTAICAHYEIPFQDAHAADADAIAAARVAWKLGQTFAELEGVELRALHDQQVIWAAEQAVSLQEYFQSQGKPERVEQAWPVMPLA